VDQTAAVIAANGHVTHEAFAPDAGRPIDCFYVYPTVSQDPGGNSDLIPGHQEVVIAQMQFAQCDGPNGANTYNLFRYSRCKKIQRPGHQRN